MRIEVNAEFICEFLMFSQWVNHAKRLLSGHGRHQVVICLDKNNNVCHIGADFMIAKENDLFPVKAYRLIRTHENNLTSLSEVNQKLK